MGADYSHRLTPGVRGASLTFAAGLVFIAAQLITATITARVLGPAGRGETTALTLWPQAASLTAGFGLPTAILYYSRLRAARLGHRTMLLLSAAALCSVGLCACLIAPLVLRSFGAADVGMERVLALFAPTYLIGAVLVARYQARGAFARAAAVTGAAPLPGLIGIAVLARAGAASPFLVSVCILGSSLPILAVASADQFRTARQPRTLDARATLAYGLGAMPTDLVTALGSVVDQAIVGIIAGPTVLGWYTVALRYGRLTTVLPQAIANVLLARTSGRSKSEIVATVGRSVRASTLISCVLATALLLAGPFAFPLIFGAQFAPAVLPAQILVVQSLAYGISTILDQALLAAGRPRVIAAINILSAAATVLIILQAIRLGGLIGVAVGLTLWAAIRIALVAGCYRLILSARMPGLIPTTADLRQLLGIVTTR